MSEGDAAQAPGGLSRVTTTLQGRTLRIALTIAALGAAAWCVAEAWRLWGAASAHGPRSLLVAENLVVTPPPAWLRANVVEEVVRYGSLQGHSILDPQLTIKVADAFRLHPWVRSVLRVSKHHPARVEVDLEYRRPVALVEVTTATAHGVLPVDEEGVLLPREDFIDQQGQLITDALKYPVIVAGESLPQGSVGASWGDRTVIDAARIAALFRDAWATCGLFKITPLSAAADDNQTFLLTARNGSQVVWGTAPGEKPKSQADAQVKVEKLVQYVNQHRPFDAGARPVAIDLRDSEHMSVVPR